jgi:lipoate-protein ligase A
MENSPGPTTPLPCSLSSILSPWTLLLDEARPGWLNMAIDAALLDCAEREGGVYLRLYRWEPYCLSFGRHEPATRRYDRARIQALGLDTVRRPTGGRAVWHARELTYSFAAPVGSGAQFRSLRSAYHAIHRLLAEALASLGVPAVLAADHPVPGPGAGPCFAAPVGGEVLVQGRKVIGSAQVRQGNAFLQHGSLLLQDDQHTLDLVRNPPPSDPPPLDPPLPLGPSFDETAQAIIAAAARRFGEPARSRLPASLAGPVERHAERFRSPEWTWSR